MRFGFDFANSSIQKTNDVPFIQKTYGLTSIQNTNGVPSVPAIGLGTWKSKPGVVGDAVRHALSIGYRHIDCAAIYGNEKEIGQALLDSKVPREDVFMTSKLWNTKHRPNDVEPALRETLKDLQIEYLDLYLMHWPVAMEGPHKNTTFLSLDEFPIIDTWRAMEACVTKGLVRSIGVSNFSIKKLKELMENARIKPAANQVEMHPYLQQPELLGYCRDVGITVIGYAPLGSYDRQERLQWEGNVPVLEDPTISSIAKAHGDDDVVTPAQVLLAWGMQRGTCVIPKSISETRQKENLASTKLTLTDEEMEAIAKLDKRVRYIDGSQFCGEESPYTMQNIWDE